MFPPIFCSLCAQKFCCARTFSQMTYICKLGEGQKNKMSLPRIGGFLCLKSLLHSAKICLYTRLYQILMTFFNCLGTFPKVVVQPPIQFTTKIFLFNICFMPPQSAFPWQCDKNRKNGHSSATTHARCKIMFSQDAEYPSSYLLSIHYISLGVQFFK